MSRSVSAENQITQGVIWKQILVFFFPILFGTFFQQLYNTFDAVIVGQFVGKQALAAGKPAVGFRLDGTPEVVLDGQTGYCTAPENVGEVVDATRKLWRTPALARQMGENGRKLVLERFDWPLMADILEREYLELLAQKARI